ncbi:MAG: hypothetical protein GXP25_07385 [Planctomycetes bacterium]|nr:hypothetical protein [Planctomycetota bacterium]
MEFIAGMSRNTHRFHRRKPSDGWNDRALCPACRLQMQERDLSVSVLMEWLHDEEMRRAFEASAVLCAPHFLILLDAVQAHDLRDYVIATQQEKLADLLYDLGEFCRKHDYRFARERFGKERDSWRRAVLAMVGRDELF